MIDVEKTIISQFANSPTIVQLIQNMNEYIDPRTDFDNFYNFVWNVDTAQYFGLDIWGRIVDVRRTLTIPAAETWDYFGFATPDDDWQPFNQSPFYSRAAAGGATETFILTDTAYRKLILVKALCNISATSYPAINQILQNLFSDRGRCYALPAGTMALDYCFEFDLEAYEYAIMTQSNAVPRPSGVMINIVSPYTP